MGKNNRMTEGKKNIIASLMQEYGIQSAEDIQDALKDLLGGTLEEMLQSEMTEHLGYCEYERAESENARNGKKPKTVRSKYGKSESTCRRTAKAPLSPKS